MPRTSNVPGCVPGVLIVIAVLALLAAHVAWGQGVTLNILDEQGNLACSLPSNGGFGGGGGAVLLAPQVPLYTQPVYPVAPPQCERSLVIIGDDRPRLPCRVFRQYRQPQQWDYDGSYNPYQFQPQQFYGNGYGGGYGSSLGALEAQNEALQRQLDAAQRYRNAEDRNAQLREELGRYGY